MKNLIVAVVFVAGVAVGFAACKAFAPKAAEPEAKSEKPVASEDADKLANAQKRIAELEKQLAVAKAAKKSEKPKEKVSEKEARKVVVNSGDDVLESLKKNLSEDEFKAATNAMSAIRAKLADKARNKIDFLKSVDVSRMSAADRKNHDKFIELAEKREAAMAKMKGGIPDPASIQEVVMLGMQMAPVAKKERSALVREAARELGYAGDDVEVVHDAMQNIYDATAPAGLDSFMDAANDAAGEAATSPDDVDVKVKTSVITL